MSKTPLKLIALSAAVAMSLSAATPQSNNSGSKKAIINTPQITKNAKDIHTLKQAVAKIIEKLNSGNLFISDKAAKANQSIFSSNDKTTLKEVLYVIGKDLKTENGEPVLDPELKQIVLQKIRNIQTNVEEINKVLEQSINSKEFNLAIKKDKFEREFGQKLPDPAALELNASKTVVDAEKESEKVVSEIEAELENETSATKQLLLKKAEDLKVESMSEIERLKAGVAGIVADSGIMDIFSSKDDKADNIKNSKNVREANKTEAVSEKTEQLKINLAPANDKSLWEEGKKLYPQLPEGESYNPKRTYSGDGNIYTESDIIGSYKKFANGEVKKYVIIQNPKTEIYDKPVLKNWGGKVIGYLEKGKVVDVDLYTQSEWLHVKGIGWIKGYFAKEK